MLRLWKPSFAVTVLAILCSTHSLSFAQSRSMGNSTRSTGGTGISGGTSFSGGGTSFSGGGTSFSGGGTSFSGGGTSFSGGGTSFSGNSSSFSGNSGSSSFGGTGTTGGTRSSGTGISATNFLSSTFANPLYQGRPGAPEENNTPGGFGQPSFGNVTTGGTSGGLGGTSGLGTTGRSGISGTSRQGGTTGGLGGTGGSTSQIGFTATSGSPVVFAASVSMPSQRPIVNPVMQTNLQGILDRSTKLTRPGNVKVEMDGGVAILRGKVANPDERRIAAGLLLLQPGVRSVRNELEIE